MAWQERENEWDNLQEVFRLVGHVSMWWSRIDLELVNLIANLLDISPAQTLVFVDRQLPARKADLAKKLIAIDSPDGEWKERAEKTLKKISSDLNERRNRYIHDIFVFQDKSISHANIHEVASKTSPQFKTISQQHLETWLEDALDVWEDLLWLTQALVPWLFEQREARQ
jgi:hypothetical protein